MTKQTQIKQLIGSSNTVMPRMLHSILKNCVTVGHSGEYTRESVLCGFPVLRQLQDAPALEVCTHMHTHTHTTPHIPFLRNSTEFLYLFILSFLYKHVKWQGLSVSQSSTNLYRLQVAQMIKNLPAPWETQIHFLGEEYPLEEGMATHSSILAWRITWTEEPGGYSP